MKKILNIFLIIGMIGCIKKPEIKEKIDFNILYEKGLEYYTQKRFQEADSVFRIIIGNAKDEKVIGKSFYYLGKIAEINKKYRESIVFYSSAFNLGFGDREKFLELLNTLQPVIVEKEIKSIPEKIKPDALIIIARNYIKENDAKSASKIYRIFLSNYPDHPMANEARNFLKGEKIKKIAVVLPLTGDYSELGKFVKEGIEKYSSSRFSLFYYDNAEDPLKTYEIMKEISQKKYDGVIGPLLSNNAVISSIFANIYNIPMVSPTATSNLPDIFGDFYISINKSSTIECYAAADYAFNTLNAKKAAVIFPESDFGRKAFSDFKEYFESLGGKIVYFESFLRKQSDFKDVLREVNRSDAEVLFIPGNPEDLILLIPQIKFYNVRANILGNSGWKSIELINKIGKDYFEGVIIFQKEMKEGVFENNEEEESKLKQLGYDAMKLLDFVLSGDITKGFGGINYNNIQLSAGSIDPKLDISKVSIFNVKNGKFQKISEK